MAKQDMIKALATATGLSQGDARAALESVGSVIRAEATANGMARVPGLGNFKVVEAKARSGTAPSGAAWATQARAVLKFKEKAA